MLLGVHDNKGLIPYILYLKSRQYHERFERAQLLFKSYLQDSQRIGLYILFMVLSTFALLYWVLYRPKNPDAPDKKNLDELPGGYLNIAILTFIILFIHMARPIKEEYINPEQPHWMMNLDNWYKKDAIRKLFGAEDEAKKTINSYGRGLKKEDLQILEGQMDKSLNILEKN